MITRHLISATMAMMILLAAVHLYRMFAPVVIFMKDTSWTVQEKSITARIYGYKILDCNVVKGSFVGWEKTDVWNETSFRFIDDLTPESTRPAKWERSSFGMWRWDVSSPNNPVRTTVQHDCNGEIRTTVLGPFQND